MRGSFSSYLIGLLFLALLASGCGDPFAPPSRVKPLPRVGDSLSSKPNFLVFVAPSAPTSGDLQSWAFRAQHEANDKRAVFRIMAPAPDQSTDVQPEIVRKALAEGASALIVYPGDAPDLPKTLAEAEAKGVPVILIDKPLAKPDGSKPFTVVEPAPFDETAKKIVATTVEDLKKASRPVEGTAIILVDSKLVDQNTGRRVQALKSAAEAAKFRQVVTVPFDGSLPDAAKLAALEAVKANPDAAIILAEDGEGLVGAAQARADLMGKPIVFVGGYFDYRSSRVITAPFRESCSVEGRYMEMGAQAVLAALARLRGESVGEHIHVTPKFARGEGVVSTETDPRSSFPQPIPIAGNEDPATLRKNATEQSKKDAAKNEESKKDEPKKEEPKEEPKKVEDPPKAQ